MASFGQVFSITFKVWVSLAILAVVSGVLWWGFTSATVAMDPATQARAYKQDLDAKLVKEMEADTDKLSRDLQTMNQCAEQHVGRLPLSKWPANCASLPENFRDTVKTIR